MNKAVFILLLFIQLVVPSMAHSAQTTQKTSAKENPVKIEKKKLGIDQSDFMPEENNFGMIASYGLFYNELEEVERKTVSHSLGFSATYSFDKYWSSYISTALSYETFNNKVFRENESDEYYNLSNTSVGLVYTKMKPIAYVLRSSNTLNFSLPTSQLSRDDEHKVAISYTNFLSGYSWKNFSLFNRIHANFLWNELKYSRTTDLVNRDWFISDSFGVNYLITQSVGLRASLNINYTHFLSGEWTQGFGNGFSAFANLEGFQIFAGISNNSYPENDRLTVFYFDEYRRLYQFGVTYAF